MIRLLDCTLRDGGFYTQWDFPLSFVQAYCQAMDAAASIISNWAIAH